MGFPAVVFTIVGVIVICHLLNVFIKAAGRCIPPRKENNPRRKQEIPPMLNSRVLLPSEVYELIEINGDLTDGEIATLSRPLSNDSAQSICVSVDPPYAGETLAVLVRIREDGRDVFGTRITLGPGDRHAFLTVDEYGCPHLRIGPFSIHIGNHLDNTITHETLTYESLFPK